MRKLGLLHAVPLALTFIALRPASTLGGDGLPAPANRTIDFGRDVEPMLTGHCTRCHGAERQRASLRLDARATLISGGRSGAAIVPGASADSLLIKKVAGLEGKRMPPSG